MKEQILAASIAIVSSFVTLIIKGCIDLVRDKNNNKYQILKELLYKKEQKAEEILKAIQIYRDIYGDFLIQLKYKRVDLAKHSPEYLENKFNGLKEKMAINLYLYFPELEADYHNYAKDSQKFNDKFSDILKAGKITVEDPEEVIKLYKGYLKSDGALASKIVDDIRCSSRNLYK